MFVGAQTKLLVTSPKITEGGAPPIPPATTSRQPGPANSAPSGLTTGSAGTSASQEGPTPPRKERAAVRPAKQIVVPLSTLDLAVQHQFKDATLFVWVDDKLVLTRPLHGAAQKRMVVFNGLHGSQSETLKVPAGKHVLRVRTLSADETIDLPNGWPLRLWVADRIAAGHHRQAQDRHAPSWQ